MYAASAWAPETRKQCVKKQLDAMQRGFVQKIIKSYRTVFLNSALLLAGMLPLDIRVREAALLFELKKGVCRRVIGDRDMEEPVNYTDMPHPADQMNLQFKCLNGDAEMEQQNNFDLKIFTDGSKIQGKVGAALSVWDNDSEIKTRKFKLEHLCIVYQAELLALHEASKQALQNAAHSCNIYCDSSSALETRNRRRFSPSPRSQNKTKHKKRRTSRQNPESIMDKSARGAGGE